MEGWGKAIQDFINSQEGELFITKMEETYPLEAEKVVTIERIKVQTASAIPHSAYYDKNGKLS